MNRHPVFVYDALRQGGFSHPMLGGSRFLGRHLTEPLYTMFRLGHFPAVVARGNTPITGEIYEVNEVVFALLDELNCYPSVFSRQLISTPAGDTWIYLYNRLVGTSDVIPRGDWLEFQATDS